MSTPLRLLIVEDNDDDAQLMLVRLRRAGYEPEYVRVDSEQGLQKALQRLDWGNGRRSVISHKRFPDMLT